MNNSAFQDKLNYHLLDSFIRQTPTILTGHFLVAVMNAGLFWQKVDHTFIFSWSICLLFVCLLRWLMKIQYSAHSQRFNPSYWRGFLH